LSHGLHVGFMTKAKGRKENAVQVNVSRFTFIFTSVRECKEGESQSLIRKNHFGSWSFEVFQIFGTKVHIINLVQIGFYSYH